MMNWLSYLQSHYIMEGVKNQKIMAALLTHTYAQSFVGMFASFFCAVIIFIGLFDPADNTRLYIWGGLFLTISFFRLFLAVAYKYDNNSQVRIPLWRNLYIFGALLGGVSWGFLGAFIFPFSTPLEQTLMVLMVAGVTAGVVPLSAAIPSATIAFLIFCISPFIISIALTNNPTYHLFDITLLLYLFYTIILSIKAYEATYESVMLKFENDYLLNDLAISNKKLIRAATHDPLTQVANRRLFKNNLEEAIDHANKAKTAIALLYIDLDNFKEVNDIYGHQAGDYILLTIIKRLEIFFRKTDHISRLGGDEFAIIIDNVGNKKDIEVIAQRIGKLICVPLKINNNELTISASIGISFFPNDGLDEETLLKVADKRMYQAKKIGGNTYCEISTV